jgi:Carboxypeptidase regulatory-like domain
MRRRFTSAIGQAATVAVPLILSAAALVYSCAAESIGAAGSVSGLVKYEGVTPSPMPVAVTKDREVCGTAPLYDESLVLGRDHGIANAVITLSDTVTRKPLKSAVVRFDQKGCRYIPHVAVFPAGSSVVIINSDGILHNIHTESAVNPVIDLAQPGFKKQIRVTIAKPEIVKVTCDAHNWMEGWWYVTDTPYYAISGVDGRYTIRDVRPGTYTVRVWQERLGTRSQKVVIRAGSVTPADFNFQSLKAS